MRARWACPRSEEAGRREDAEAGAEQGDLRVDPDGLEIAAEFESVVAVNVSEILGDLEMLLVIEVDAADEPAGGEQVGNIESGLETGADRIQIESAAADSQGRFPKSKCC